MNVEAQLYLQYSFNGNDIIFFVQIKWQSKYFYNILMRYQCALSCYNIELENKEIREMIFQRIIFKYDKFY